MMADLNNPSQSLIMQHLRLELLDIDSVVPILLQIQDHWGQYLKWMPLGPGIVMGLENPYCGSRHNPDPDLVSWSLFKFRIPLMLFHKGWYSVFLWGQWISAKINHLRLRWAWPHQLAADLKLRHEAHVGPNQCTLVPNGLNIIIGIGIKMIPCLTWYWPLDNVV